MSSTAELPPFASEAPLPPPCANPAHEHGPSPLPGTQGRNAPHADSLVYIDVLRVLAALAVVVIHVSDRVVTQLDPCGPVDWWIGLFAESSTRWAVPVFVMISGVLMLTPSRNEPLGVFLRRRGLRILPPLLFWSAIYLGAHALIINHLHLQGMPAHFALDDALELLAYGAPADHLWYLCMLPGLYLLVLPWRDWVRRVSPAQCLAAAAAILGVGSVYRCTLAYFTDGREIAWFSGILLSGYLLLGYWLSRSITPRAACATGLDAQGRSADQPPLSTRVLGTRLSLARGKRPIAASAYGWLALFGAGATATVLGTWFMLSDSGNTEARFVLFNPLSPSVIAMALAVFVLALQAPWTATSRFAALCHRWAPATFGVYLIHPLVMSVCRRVLGLSGSTGGALCGILLTSLVVCVISYFTVSIILRTPYLRRVC